MPQFSPHQPPALCLGVRPGGTQPPYRLVYLPHTTCLPAGPTLCRFFSRGGRLSRIIFMALRGGSLK